MVWWPQAGPRSYDFFDVFESNFWHDNTGIDVSFGPV
jgi:hypothetical protein